MFRGDSKFPYNLDGYFAFQDTCMLPFLDPQEIRKLFVGDSKLPDHHQANQEAQGHPPSSIKEI